jgi:hypothetical protein
MKYLFLAFAISAALTNCNEEKKSDNPSTTTMSNAPTDVALPKTGGSNGTTETITVVDPATGRRAEAQRPKDALSTAISENPTMVKDPIAPKAVAPQPAGPQESRVVRVLTSNYWVVWALHRIKNPSNKTNQGTWFKFNPDGSYDYGFFDKPIARGAWKFDPKTANLFLDSELAGDDREWNLKINSEEDIMVWVGTDKFHTTDIQLKLQNFLFIPKHRKEIGLED